ncbi:MAG: adaptor protein MecA [Clostridia bacterium]|nr:adaptor protein MecA [Clostridia bacterium]
MNIHSLGKNKFIVELSRSDMQELDITYEEMDYSKIETRRVIWTILQKVRDDFGKDVDPTGNLLIEASADSQGGCVLSFTVSEKRRSCDLRQALKLTKTTDSIVYEFSSENALLDMLTAVGASAFKNQNRLFKNGERFRLVLKKQPGYADKMLIEEYGAQVGRDTLTLSHTFEHWQSVGML